MTNPEGRNMINASENVVNNGPAPRVSVYTYTVHYFSVLSRAAPAVTPAKHSVHPTTSNTSNYLSTLSNLL